MTRDATVGSGGSSPSQGRWRDPWPCRPPGTLGRWDAGQIIGASPEIHGKTMEKWRAYMGFPMILAQNAWFDHV